MRSKGAGKDGARSGRLTENRKKRFGAGKCRSGPLLMQSGNNGARTHDLPLVRRALSQLSYVSVNAAFGIKFQSDMQPCRKWTWRESNPSHVSKS